jgi:predicted RNase H-like HicB family nuclease
MRPITAYHALMALQLTAVFQKVPEGYIGFVEELPGANTQGATLAEARENLQEAIALVLQANREIIEETSRGHGSSAVPRHAEINDSLARKICRDLGVPEP